MKKIIVSLAIAIVVMSCKSGNNIAVKNSVDVTIDLVNVTDDKVKVEIVPPSITTETIGFQIPKIVPGTYSEDNYGRYIENLKALDADGNQLRVTKTDENSYTIDNAKKLAKVTYWVNDTYDIEGGEGFGKSEDIFSPAGTNIEKGKNFMLNTHAFVGYFTNKAELKYNVNIKHPADLFGATSLIDTNPSNEMDTFVADRYAELVDNPMMYCKPDITQFNVEGMDIVISVYSPTGKFKAADITPETEKFMRAQKKFLGKFNANKKYVVLLYLSDMQTKDAKGFGALEHMTSTTMVMPEAMPLEALKEQMKDVVSHEFFHIVTPLSVHSREIQYFDFNTPKMSEHLWMYEGITEYFANLFQVNQGLIDENAFYERMNSKIEDSRKLDDKMSFTKMSKNVLTAPYKEQYINVYQKGALIAMCLDIQLRESSNGQKGILNLMQDLSNTFGKEKPFNDSELFETITKISYPEVGQFLTTHVAGETPIDYDFYFAKMGVGKNKSKKASNPFLNGQTPSIGVTQATKEIYVLDADLNVFYTNLNMKANDVILEVNNTKYNLDNIYDMVIISENWKENEAITVKIKRDGKEQILKGTIKLPMQDNESYNAVNPAKETLKNAWLKN